MDEVLIGRVLQYFIPSFFSMLFRAYGLGAKSRKHAVLGLTYYTFVSTVATFVLINAIGYDSYRLLGYPVAIAANLGVLIISSDGFLKTCFFHFTQINIVFWVTVTASSIRRMCNLSYLEGNVIQLILSGLTLYLGLRFASKPLRFIADHIRGSWLGFLSIPLCIHLSAMGMAVYLGIQPSYPELGMIAFVSILELSFLFYMFGLNRTMREGEQFAKERQNHALLQREIHSLDEAVETSKRNRHDLRHHNAILLNYLQMGQTDEATHYLEQMNARLECATIQSFCSHPTANAVLSIYHSRAKGLCLPFSVQADIPQSLPLADTQLVELLSNLLENAMESCVKLPEIERFITLTAETLDRGWKLELRNATHGHVQFQGSLPRSTKPVGGIGTKSVLSIVESANGVIRFQQEDSVFSVRIYLPM